jgi:hypothetical protein
MKAAKKSGAYSKEEKRALKSEVKGVGRRLKGSVKGAWKGRA